MSSIGLSFGHDLAGDRPRSLTSAVQERLRADILSTRLLGFRDVLHEQSERYRRLSIRRDTAKSRDVELEHAAIVRAVLKRNADAAVAALSEHFLTTMHLVELADAESSAGIT